MRDRLIYERWRRSQAGLRGDCFSCRPNRVLSAYSGRVPGIQQQELVVPGKQDRVGRAFALSRLRVAED